MLATLWQGRRSSSCPVHGDAPPKKAGAMGNLLLFFAIHFYVGAADRQQQAAQVSRLVRDAWLVAAAGHPAHTWMRVCCMGTPGLCKAVA